eukprot:CAMPEP_0117450386 /NCGR_PEP_ID=MMETSP0759-20121206/8441_1 /TAXON_ID=63605 /ORGANISM="Percolomonas cosmopolitus, Strain WS" /LENGTH=246 /DNA_ID=CAMNT_0005242905 /DNA_START=8 /DNA_END=748 /DNA_ORIENTATION=+
MNWNQQQPNPQHSQQFQQQQQRQQQPQLPLFGLLIPPGALISNYTQQSPTQFVFAIPKSLLSTKIQNSTSTLYSAPEIIIFKFPNTQPIPSGCSIGIYYCGNEKEGFEYLGFLSEEGSSVKVRVPEIHRRDPQQQGFGQGLSQQQQSHGFLPVPSQEASSHFFVGLSLEPHTETLNKHQNSTLSSQKRQHSQIETTVKACANSIHSYLTSFVQQQGDKIVIPANAIDRWLQKIEKKVSQDPDFFLR